MVFLLQGFCEVVGVRASGLAPKSCSKSSKKGSTRLTTPGNKRKWQRNIGRLLAWSSETVKKWTLITLLWNLYRGFLWLWGQNPRIFGTFWYLRHLGPSGLSKNVSAFLSALRRLMGIECKTLPDAFHRTHELSSTPKNTHGHWTL